jgi:hypothetical protein
MLKVERHHELIAKVIYWHGNRDQRWKNGKTKLI